MKLIKLHYFESECEHMCWDARARDTCVGRAALARSLHSIVLNLKQHSCHPAVN